MHAAAGTAELSRRSVRGGRTVILRSLRQDTHKRRCDSWEAMHTRVLQLAYIPGVLTHNGVS